MEIDGAAVKTEFRGEFVRSDLGPGFWQQGENLPKIPFAVRNFVVADKRWGNLTAKDQIATGNLEPQAFRATQQFPGEMVVEADLVTDVLDFTVIGDEVALETGTVAFLIVPPANASESVALATSLLTWPFR